MFTESAKPFYNSASILELNAIPAEIYSSFANELFEERGKHLEDGCVRWVSEIFEGNTFYIQKTFNIAFAQTPSNGTCNKTIINYAIEEMLASFDTIYREILSRMGESPKQLLIALAQTGTAHQITSVSFIRKHALASSSSVQASTRRLLSEGFLIRQGNSYKLQDPLLRQWLLSVYGK